MTSESEDKSKGDSKVAGKIPLGGIAEKLQVVAGPVIKAITVVIPLLITYTQKAKQLYDKLPKNVLAFAAGFLFCFFGGMYPVLFAAYAAAEQGGRQTVMAAIEDLSEEALTIIEESKKDDKVDADGDGKADVAQISGQELVTRKTLLVIKKMNPAKVDNAINSMYKVWLSVAAVLMIEFARAIAMALSIAEFLKKPVNRFLAPAVQLATPDDYDKWVPVILGWICKSIGMSIAWYIQAVRSAFASALTGGLMMARALYQELADRGIKLGGWIPDNHEESNLDEILSYVFAALGFCFQFMVGFKMPFPLNVFAFPFEIAEFAMRWAITSSNSVPPS